MIVKQEKVLGLSAQIISGEVNLAFYEMSLTIKETLTQPLIIDVFKGDAEEISFHVVNALCTRFINSFAFSSKISPEQIEVLTVDTLDAFGHESLQDIILFFKMARSGKFGNTKRSVDSNLIYGEWFPAYMDKKAKIRENIYLENKSKNKENDVSIDVVKERYLKYQKQKILDKRIQDAKDFVDNVSKNFDRQMLEDTITEWFKDSKKDYYTKLLKKKRRTIK